MESAASVPSFPASASDPTNDVATVEQLRASCRIAGVRFVGVQQGYGRVPNQLLFQPLEGLAAKTTLSVSADFATPWVIQTRVRAAEANFSEAAA